MQMRAGVAKKTIRSIRQQAFEATHLFDSHPESSLDFEKVRAAVTDGYEKPFLLIDSTIVREKTRRFTAAMPRARPHYAIKANPDPRILKLMLEEGAGFEIASVAELDLLVGLGIPGADVFYSNPVKSRDQIAYAASKGVQWYVIDSVEELKKIQSIKADAQLYLRVDTPNIGSDCRSPASSARKPPRCATSSLRRRGSRSTSRASPSTGARRAATPGTGPS